MSDPVFVVSEWLPKKGKDQALWEQAKEIMALTGKEKGCLRAHATRQITHPNAPGKSKYTIVLFQEYVNLQAFDTHCKADYVSHFFEKYVANEDTAIVEEWTCRLFSERR
ncbi:MAG TPA: antibiotic biosynthesis monooxygenase [Rhabdochlamydiaceae bacterium]|jgi:quinol monooxygenase YgiN